MGAADAAAAIGDATNPRCRSLDDDDVKDDDFENSDARRGRGEAAPGAALSCCDAARSGETESASGDTMRLAAVVVAATAADCDAPPVRSLGLRDWLGDRCARGDGSRSQVALGPTGNCVRRGVTDSDGLAAAGTGSDGAGARVGEGS